MDESTLYAKTPQGAAEVAARSAGLSLTQRRVLIMIDGKRTVAELAPYAKPGELADLLTLLEGLQLIERVGGAPPPQPPPAAEKATAAQPAGSAPRANPDGEERNVITLEEARRRAVRGLIDRVGPDGETLAERIERARTIDELRERLREAERMVAGVRGAEAAADFMRELRRR